MEFQDGILLKIIKKICSMEDVLISVFGSFLAFALIFCVVLLWKFMSKKILNLISKHRNKNNNTYTKYTSEEDAYQNEYMNK